MKEIIVYKIYDKYNKDKVWLIKKYKSSNFYINQMIKGKHFYKKFQRTTLKHILSILNIKSLKVA
jgi:Mor family transcriptional regulator